jgi:DNA-directed RNA polymerase beta subunit
MSLIKDNDQTLASLLIQEPNYLHKSQISSFDKFLKKDLSEILNTNNEFITATADNIMKIGYVKVVNLTFSLKPFNYDDIVAEDRTLSIDVYGQIQQCIRTIDLVSKKETEQIIQPDGGFKNVLIAKVPSLVVKHDIESNPYELKGVLLHKGAPLTFVPYDTYPENKPLSLYRKVSGVQVVAVDFWSQDHLNPSVVQRYSVSYKKSSAKKSVKVVFMQFNMFQDEFPVILMLYALGMTNHVEILSSISVDKTIQSMFVSSFTDIVFTIKEKAGLPIVSQNDAIEELAHRVKYMNYKSIIDDKMPGRNEMFIKKILRNYIFPHIHGTDRTKAIYLCSMICKCLKISVGYETIDNRDSYNFKRLEPTRNILRNIYTGSWDKIMRDLRKTAKRIFQNNANILFEEGSKIPNLAESIRFDYLSKDIISVLNVGFWKKSQYHPSKTVCESLRNVNNAMEALFICRKLPSPSNLENNNNYSPRLFFGEHLGFVCEYSTPEGKQIGLTTELALSSHISIGNEEDIDHIKILLATEDRRKRLKLIPIDDIPLMEIHALTIVILNGEPIYGTTKGLETLEELRYLRFHGDISREHVGFIYDGFQIRINTCSGRLYRPLLVVRNNNLVLPAEALGFVTDGTIKSFNQLMQKYPEAIEFVDTDEYTNMCLVACLPSDLTKEKNLEMLSRERAKEGKMECVDEITYKEYTHCEIHPIFALGIVASTTPFSNHNQGPKNGAQCQMKKQAISACPDNKITNKTRKTEMWYPGIPIASTFTSRVMHLDDLPSGDNVIVATASYLGFNQEDSNIMNSTSLERGLFRANFTRLYKDVIDNTTDSSIGVFKKPNLLDISSQKNVNFSLLNEHGYAPPGTYLIGDHNDVLINKQVPISTGKAGVGYKNIQTKVQRGEEGIVEIVMNGTNQDGNKFIKSSLLNVRNPEIGDKYACFIENVCDVLTTTGWKRIEQVTCNDKVACLDHNNQLCYEHPEDVHQYDCNDLIYEVQSEFVELSVTPYHRMWVKKTNDHHFAFEYATNLMNKKIKYLSHVNNFIPESWCGDMYREGLSMDDWLKFLGSWIMNRDNNYHEHHDLSGDIRILDSLRIDGEKQLPDSVWNLNTAQSHLLLRTILGGTRNQAITRTKKFADDICKLAIHAGSCSTIKQISQNVFVVSVMSPTEHTVNDNQTFHLDTERWMEYTGKVYCLTVRTGVFMVRQNGKPVWSGNSRHGQKNTLGNLYHQAYMPFSDNYTADIIINPHMLPSRMTTGQLLEAMVSKYANMKCEFTDVTPYQRIDIDELKHKLKELGFDEYGKEYVICGLTGKQMEMKMFIGPTYYQRLRHMVADKVHARGYSGPVTQSTRQPTDGRSKGGGYKIGEMERDGIIAHGTATTIRQLYTNHSDGMEFDICSNNIDGKQCGTFCYLYDTAEDGSKIYLCPMCQSSLHVNKVSMPFTFKLLVQLLYGLKIRTRLIVDNEPLESTIE